MNFKAAFRYQISEYKKSIVIYYFVVLLVIAFFFTIISAGQNSNFTSDGGIEISTSIFLFVAGLNSFKETFRMLMQNGISRKTLFLTRAASLLVICSLMAVIDRILIALLSLLNGSSNQFHISGLYDQIYAGRVLDINVVLRSVEGLFFSISIYLAGIAFGYFITVAYYRMSKAAKTAVSIGVPVGVFVVLPLVDATMTRGKIIQSIAKLAKFAFGIDKGIPYYLYVTCILLFCVFMGLSWLLLRKAVDKN